MFKYAQVAESGSGDSLQSCLRWFKSTPALHNKKVPHILKEIEELHQKFGFKIDKIEKVEETRKIHKKTLTSRYFLTLLGRIFKFDKK